MMMYIDNDFSFPFIPFDFPQLSLSTDASWTRHRCFLDQTQMLPGPEFPAGSWGSWSGQLTFSLLDFSTRLQCSPSLLRILGFLVWPAHLLFAQDLSNTNSNTSSKTSHYEFQFIEFFHFIFSLLFASPRASPAVLWIRSSPGPGLLSGSWAAFRIRISR